MYRRELAERAAMLYRLGHSLDAAVARLAANVAWDFEATGEALSDEDIRKLVADTYARRPSHSAAGGKPRLPM